jgi:hypothetical protein
MWLLPCIGGNEVHDILTTNYIVQMDGCIHGRIYIGDPLACVEGRSHSRSYTLGSFVPVCASLQGLQQGLGESLHTFNTSVEIPKLSTRVCISIALSFCIHIMYLVYELYICSLVVRLTNKFTA